MIYTEQILRQVHQVQLEILQEFIRICQKYNLQYFAVYGTGIGVVRHQGFIPWDDDIDVGMMREDYDKFLKYAPTELNKSIMLQCFQTEPSYPGYFLKLRKNNTLFLEGNLRHVKMHHGIFIDVFPFDYAPENSAEQAAFNRKGQFLYQLYMCKSLWSTDKHCMPNRFKRYAFNFSRTLCHILLLPVRKEFLFRKLDSFARKYDDRPRAYVCSVGQGEVFRFSAFLPVTEMTFENIQIAVPVNYDDHLSQQYGDYMRLPPEDRRVSHGPVKLSLDTEM